MIANCLTNKSAKNFSSENQLVKIKYHFYLLLCIA